MLSVGGFSAEENLALLEDDRSFLEVISSLLTLVVVMTNRLNLIRQKR